MQGLCDSTASWRAINNSSLAELVRNLAILIHDEPVVQMAIRILTSHCLGGGGIQLRYGTTKTPPSPNFQAYLDKYFFPFCKDAIVSYLAVGFVPYRIRKNEKGASVPEVLPLGTYTWHVGKANQSSVATPWESIGKPPALASETTVQEVDRSPILKYIVQSAYCSGTIHVFPFVNPQILFSCTSPFASLVQPYLLLNHKRNCSIRADEFNSKPSMVFEQQEKVLLNEIGNSGLALQNPKDMDGKMILDQRNIGERQLMLQQMIDESKGTSHLPAESISVIAPKNHSVHALEKVVSPQDVLKEELQFSRMVAMACGLPTALLMQGGSAIGAGSGSSSGGAGNWAENTEGSNRLLLDTCRNINVQLEQLLYEVHHHIYGSDGGPHFEIPVVPTIPFEQLIMAYGSYLIDDKHFSMILKSTWGFSLSDEAGKARLEKRKAELILPFQNKASQESSTPKKKK